MARILVVSDNVQDIQTLEAAVAGQPHHVQHTASGLDGCIRAAEARPDVVLVGERTTDQDGLSVMRHLRSTLDSGSLLVMPLGQNDSPNRIAAYEAGADDTFSRPLDIAEVGLRLRALLRRTEKPDGHDWLESRDLRLNLTERVLYVRGERIELRPIDFDVMEILLEVPGRTVSHEELLERVWGTSAMNRENIRLSIYRLRLRIGKSLIETNGRHGYRVAV